MNEIKHIFIQCKPLIFFFCKLPIYVLCSFFFHCVLVLFILTCMLSWYIKEIGPLSCVLQIYFPIVVLGYHEETGQDKRSTTQ